MPKRHANKESNLENEVNIELSDPALEDLSSATKGGKKTNKQTQKHSIVLLINSNTQNEFELQGRHIFINNQTTNQIINRKYKIH